MDYIKSQYETIKKTWTDEDAGRYLVPVSAAPAPPLIARRRRDRPVAEGPEGPPFWVDNPLVLLKRWNEWLPDATMTRNEQLNALSRFLIALVLVTYFFTQQIRILLIGFLSLGAVVVFYRHVSTTETFIPDIDPQVQRQGVDVAVAAAQFDEPKVGNPLCNVLLTDYIDNPQKKPAPPVDNPSVRQEIYDKTKETLIQLNPSYAKILKNSSDEFDFEQSMRPFYTQPSSTIPNDQEAFSQFCYGSMISCKEGNAFACARHDPRYQT
jgi:hypothetical protein